MASRKTYNKLFRSQLVNGIVLLVCFSVSCSKQNADAVTKPDTNSVTKKIVEQDRDGDGKPDLRIETQKRGKTTVFIKREKKLTNGAWSAVRNFMISGHEILIEEDKDGDGFFQTRIVFDQQSDDLEVFLLHKDGSVVVAASETREAYRRMFSAVKDIWSNPLDGKTGEELIRKTQDKINSAGREIEANNPPPNSASGEPKKTR